MAVKKFELEQVLGYRRDMEKVRKLEFATSKRNLERANDDLRREEDHANGLSAEFRSRQEELGCIDDIRMYSDCFKRKREDIKNHKERIIHLDIIMNESREYLFEASKDKKILESLKEKKLQEFRLNMQHRERQFLDEISIHKKVKPD